MLVKKIGSYADAAEFIRQHETAIRKEYIDKDLTAKKVAERFNVQHNQHLVRALFNVIGSKGKGWGGERQGSGNKPGIRFCPECGKSRKNCKC